MKRKREEGKDWPRDKVLVLNIGGQKFTLHRDSILAQPNTKLAKMFKAGRLDVNHGDSLDKRQYYFDRPFKFFPITPKISKRITKNTINADMPIVRKKLIHLFFALLKTNFKNSNKTQKWMWW